MRQKTRTLAYFTERSEVLTTVLLPSLRISVLLGYPTLQM